MLYIYDSVASFDDVDHGQSDGSLDSGYDVIYTYVRLWTVLNNAYCLYMYFCRESVYTEGRMVEFSEDMAEGFEDDYECEEQYPPATSSSSSSSSFVFPALSTQFEDNGAEQPMYTEPAIVRGNKK